MQPRRPTSVLVVAIVNLILGAFGVFGVFGVVMSLALVSGDNRAGPRPPNAPPPNPGIEMHQAMVREVPGYLAMTVGGGLLLGAASVGAIVDSIGLLQLRPWARPGCLAYAGYLIVQHAAGMTYNFVWVVPAVERWQADFARNNPRLPPMIAAAATFGIYVGIVFAVVYILWGVTVLFLMTRPHVKAAFAGPNAAAPRPEEEYDRRLGY